MSESTFVGVIAGGIAGGIVTILVMLNLARQRGTKPCPNCGENLPVIRMPRNLRQFLWGGWSCSRCGTEFDSLRKKIGG